ncbi:MAG: baseplate J/gp47 family protein, partial [Rikenellaceae bacterium]
MARTIKEIEAVIKSEIFEKLNLSTSHLAEWKLWSTTIASVIYSFEVIMDAFMREIEERTDKAIPGTLRWYTTLCRKWQFGDTLQYNKDTLEVYYEEKNPNKQIIAALAVIEGDRHLTIKIAKALNNVLVPLSDTECFSFKNYIDRVKFAGDRFVVISTRADVVNYDIDIYSDTLTSTEALKENIKQCLDKYRTSVEFGGTVYLAHIISAMIGIEG